MSGNERVGHVLVVEDEAHLAAGLKLNLELEGYVVDVAPTAGEAGRLLIRDVPYSLILLDVMLPDMNGYDFCERVRASGNITPILMLTALGTPEERVRGLEAGADDYLAKPFELSELLARVKAQIRRQSWAGNGLATTTRTELRFGHAVVDFTAQKAFCDGARVSLTKLEFDLLSYFAENPGRVLTRDELLREVWGLTGTIRSRTVDNFVLRLRKVFEVDPAAPKYILSIRGSGYLFDPTGTRVD